MTASAVSIAEAGSAYESPPHQGSFDGGGNLRGPYAVAVGSDGEVYVSEGVSGDFQIVPLRQPK